MPLCFLMTKQEEILLEKIVPVLNNDEVDDEVVFYLKEMQDLYGYSFTLSEGKENPNISFLLERNDPSIQLRVFMEQSSRYEYPTTYTYVSMTEDDL